MDQAFSHSREVFNEIELEQSILGGILVDNRRLEPIVQLLKPEEFADPFHQRIYATMLQLFEQGHIITDQTLTAIMRNDPGLITLDMDYFGALRKSAPSVISLKELARIVHETAVRRELMRIGEDLVNASAVAHQYVLAGCQCLPVGDVHRCGR